MKSHSYLKNTSLFLTRVIDNPLYGSEKARIYPSEACLTEYLVEIRVLTLRVEPVWNVKFKKHPHISVCPMSAVSRVKKRDVMTAELERNFNIKQRINVPFDQKNIPGGINFLTHTTALHVIHAGDHYARVRPKT